MDTSELQAAKEKEILLTKGEKKFPVFTSSRMNSLRGAGFPGQGFPWGARGPVALYPSRNRAAAASEHLGVRRWSWKSSLSLEQHETIVALKFSVCV